MTVRDDVLKKLEIERAEKRVGKSLEAKAIVTAPDPLYPLLQACAADLPAVFIVSQVELREGAYSIEIQAADGVKCERCWKYTLDVGSNPEFPTLCAACSDAIK